MQARPHLHDHSEKIRNSKLAADDPVIIAFSASRTPTRPTAVLAEKSSPGRIYRQSTYFHGRGNGDLDSTVPSGQRIAFIIGIENDSKAHEWVFVDEPITSALALLREGDSVTVDYHSAGADGKRNGKIRFAMGPSGVEPIDS